MVVEYAGEHPVDGLQIARDDVRLRRLVAAGWTVVRVWESDVLSDPDCVADAIDRAVRVANRHSRPMPK